MYSVQLCVISRRIVWVGQSYEYVGTAKEETWKVCLQLFIMYNDKFVEASSFLLSGIKLDQIWCTNFNSMLYGIAFIIRYNDLIARGTIIIYI